MLSVRGSDRAEAESTASKTKLLASTHGFTTHQLRDVWQLALILCALFLCPVPKSSYICPTSSIEEVQEKPVRGLLKSVMSPNGPKGMRTKIRTHG